jgi:tetratricopeptide (TPR) repeat protein
MGVSATALAQGSKNAACAPAVLQREDIVAARSALEKTPAVPARRIALSDLLVQAECYNEAIHVLEDGEALNPRNVLLQSHLSQARSMVREEQYFAGLDDAEASARLARGKLRCTRLNDVAACDEVLNLQPRNLDMLLAKGDALTKVNRNDEAAATYARAAQVAPDNAAIAARLQSLQAQRQDSLKRCMSGQGERALQACIASLVKGAPNEFDLTQRIAILQQSTSQPALALESYITANSLRPGDKSVALAILALLNITQRSDAVALAAKGSSLMTLGRAIEAVAPLRQANLLAPGMPDIVKLLASAETLSRKEAARRKDSQAVVTKGTVDAATSQTARTFSNAAPPTKSN